jgi:hypothetical protein
MNFVERFKLGLETEDSIDDWINTWHKNGGEGKTLHKFLGMSWDEYATWVEQKGTLQETLGCHASTIHRKT